MIGQTMSSFKKLAKKLSNGKSQNQNDQKQTQYQRLIQELDQEDLPVSPSATTPIGLFAVYVGEERERFAVPTSFLNHPLFKMLLEKSYNEVAVDQRSRLVIPCSVETFQEVGNAVKCCNGNFDFSKLVEEFL